MTIAPWEVVRMIRWILGIFLILHGVAHAFFPSYGSYDSWLFGESRGLALVLMVIATALLVIAGIAVLIQSSWWPSLTLIAAIESLLFLMLYWEPGLIVGIGLNVAIIGGIIYWTRGRGARYA